MQSSTSPKVSQPPSQGTLLDRTSKVPLQCSFLENPSGVILGSIYPHYLFLILLKLYASSQVSHTSSQVHTDQMACKASRNAQRPLRPSPLWWSPNFRLPVVTKGDEREPHLSQLLHLCGSKVAQNWTVGEKMGPQSCGSVPRLRVKYFYIPSSLQVIQSPAVSSRIQLQSFFHSQDPSYMYGVVKQS